MVYAVFGLKPNVGLIGKLKLESGIYINLKSVNY